MRRYGINDFGDLYQEAGGEYCLFASAKEELDAERAKAERLREALEEIAACWERGGSYHKLFLRDGVHGIAKDALRDTEGDPS